MDISNIIYYSWSDDKGKTLPLRDLCLKEKFESKLESIFYAARDAVSTEDLLNKFRNMCHESFEISEETTSYIVFDVVDAYGNTNYLKFQKQKVIKRENENEYN